ncbi:uncharacterized protein J3R85_009751 [Psidium guajava]|nr:uncharacterized protein J3R85_009751 [Psidium guajava]
MVSSGGLHPEQVEVNADPHHPSEEDVESEEALSLCDLPIYSNSAGWDDEFADAGKRRSSAEELDFFEFSSEDLSSSFAYPSDNKIVFCGKIIPYRLPPDQAPKPQNKNHDRNKPKKKRGFFLFRWGSLLSSKSRNGRSSPWRISSSRSLPMELEKYECGHGYMRNKGVDEYDFGKVKILTPRLKSRWYLLMFGLKKLPAEMELADIRTRQSRKTPSTMFRSGDGEVVKGGRTNAENGPWSSRHELRAVKKIMGCIPHF